MKNKFAGMILGAAILAGAPLLAHHAFSSVFDEAKPITLIGKVTKIEWMNPHVWFYIDVAGADGKVVNWACETGPPSMLGRNGWKKDNLKVGDAVTVQAFRAKDGTNNVSARTTLFPDGRKVLTGQANEDVK